MKTTKCEPAVARPGPPSLDWAQLTCHAKFDYIKVWHPKKALLPALSGTKRWTKVRYGRMGYALTVQDPQRADIDKVIDALGNPVLMALQLTVDILPKPGVAAFARERLLLNTFMGVAGRFRPEDEARWGYGTRGATNAVGKAPRPFHRRFPDPDEELVYGQRGGWMQATAYLKRTNERSVLDQAEHRMRMEVTLERGGLMDFGINQLADLRGFAYRSTFTKHFRIVSHPRVRAVTGRPAKGLLKAETRMWRGWATAGVGKFAIATDFPPDTIDSAARRIRARQCQQLPLSD